MLKKHRTDLNLFVSVPEFVVVKNRSGALVLDQYSNGPYQE